MNYKTKSRIYEAERHFKLKKNTMQPQIYISGKQIETTDFPFTLSFALSELEDISKRKAFKTSTITVSATSVNLQAFGFPNIVSVRHVDGLRGEIVYKGFSFHGDVVIYDTEQIDNRTYINFQIVSSSIAEKLRGVMLQDLALRENVTLTRAEITGQRSAKNNETYALFDHGGFRDSDNIRVVDFHPIVRVEHIFEKILAKIGYKLHGDSLINGNHYIADFARLRINDVDFDSKNRITGLTADDALNWSDNYTPPMGTSQRYVTPTGLSATSNPVYKLKYFDLTDNNELVTETENYNVQADGAFRFLVNVDLTYTMILGDWVNTPTIKATLKRTRNANTTVIDEKVLTPSESNAELNISIDTSFVHCQGGDVFFVEFYFDALLSATAPNMIEFNLNTAASFEVQADSRRGIGATLNFADILPAWSATEFIKAYATYMNLLIVVNEFTREVLILNYENFYSEQAQDWSEKLVQSKPVKVFKLEIPARYVFRLERDNNDISFVEGDNEAVKVFDKSGTDENLVQVPFSKTYMDGAYRIAGLTRSEVIPLILDSPVNVDEIPERKFEFRTRLLNYVTVHSLVNPYTIEGQTNTNWPEYNQNGLGAGDFKDNYRGLLRNVELSKVMEATFVLSPVDLQKILLLAAGDFRTAVYINGIYYWLISINRWDARTEQAVCRLLQVNDKNVKL